MAHSICLHNGRIYGLQGLQDATAVVIDEGIIRFIGNEAMLRHYDLGSIEKIDVGGRIIFPGFIDSHIHLTEWARRRGHLELNSFRSLKETCAYIADNAEDKEWLIGGGWNQNAWKEQRFPHRHDLNFLGPGTKAIFYSKDFHSAWVNEALINLFDFSDVLRMLRKGYIQRDADGQLSGLLREEALAVLLDPLLKTRPVGIFDHPEKYFSDFYQHGITSVHTMENFENYRNYLSLYQYEHHRGLRLGIYIYNSDSKQVFEHGLRHGIGGEWLRFLGLKIFIDGALGSQTAWLRKPYETGIHHGKKLLHSDALKKVIAQAESHGCALAVHAIGDAAVEHVLDILDSLGRELRVPLRIEHAQLLDNGLIERIKDHNIHCSVNPSHLIDDKPIAELHWGKRSRGAFPYRSLKIASVSFGFASDAPVEDIHPWKGIYAAVMRIPVDDTQPWYPEESIRLTDAIHAYTYYSAQLSGCNEKKGVLALGYMGDCFVCNQDVFQISLSSWRDIRSVLTIIRGKIVYDEMGR